MVIIFVVSHVHTVQWEEFQNHTQEPLGNFQFFGSVSGVYAETHTTSVRNRFGVHSYIVQRSKILKLLQVEMCAATVPECGVDYC